MPKKQKLTSVQKAAIKTVVHKYLPKWSDRYDALSHFGKMSTLPGTMTGLCLAMDMFVMGGFMFATTAALTVLPALSPHETMVLNNKAGQNIEADQWIHCTLKRMEQRLAESFAAVADAQPADRRKRLEEFHDLRDEISLEREILSPGYKVVENPEGIKTNKYVFDLRARGTEETQAVLDMMDLRTPAPRAAKRTIKFGK